VLPRGMGRPPREDLRSLRPQGGIEPFDALIEQFTTVEPLTTPSPVS